jgi:outer membrane protein
MRKLVLLAVAFAGIAAAQVKVGVINSQKALVDTAEIKKAQKDLEDKFRPRQQEMEKLQKDLQAIQTQLQNPSITPSAGQDLQTQGQRKQRELTRVEQDLRDDVDRERNDVLQRAGQRMQEVVKKIAEEKGLDVIIDSSNTLYFKSALELTAEATTGYDKAYPVK